MLKPNNQNPLACQSAATQKSPPFNPRLSNDGCRCRYRSGTMSGFRYDLVPHQDFADGGFDVCGDRNIAFGRLFITAFGIACGRFFLTLPGCVAVRRFRLVFWGFPGVVGHIPSSSFEVERAMGNKLVKFARTMLASGKRFIRKLLNDFFNPAALIALVFVDRHIRDSLLGFIDSNDTPIKKLA